MHATRRHTLIVPQLSRRALLGTLGALTTTGCLAGPRTGTTRTGPATSGPPTDTRSPTGGTPTGNWIQRASNSPDADHAVYLGNEGTRERSVRVRVVRRATGDAVFDGTLTIAPGTEREVYNLKQASPAGIEAFAVCGRLAEPSTVEPAASASESTRPSSTEASGTPGASGRDCATVKTNECYGTAHVTVRDDGGVGVIYAIC